MNIILRIIATPFVFILYAIIHVHITIKGTFLFLRYGGEWLTYMRDDKASISKIYTELKNNLPKE